MRLGEELEVLDDPDGADREALAAALGRSA
jgi:hypothetical protein